MTNRPDAVQALRHEKPLTTVEVAWRELDKGDWGHLMPYPTVVNPPPAQQPLSDNAVGLEGEGARDEDAPQLLGISSNNTVGLGGEGALDEGTSPPLVASAKIAPPQQGRTSEEEGDLYWPWGYWQGMLMTKDNEVQRAVSRAEAAEHCVKYMSGNTRKQTASLLEQMARADSYFATIKEQWSIISVQDLEISQLRTCIAVQQMAVEEHLRATTAVPAGPPAPVPPPPGVAQDVDSAMEAEVEADVQAEVEAEAEGALGGTTAVPEWPAGVVATDVDSARVTEEKAEAEGEVEAEEEGEVLEDSTVSGEWPPRGVGTVLDWAAEADRWEEQDPMPEDNARQLELEQKLHLANDQLEDLTWDNAVVSSDLAAVCSQRDAMRTMLGKLGALLEQVVGLAFPQPSGSEAATRVPGAQLRDRLQEKLRGVLFRFLDAYDDGALGLDDLKHWRDINLALLESADSSEAVSLEDVWRQLEDLFDQPPLPGVRPPAFAQQGKITLQQMGACGMAPGAFATILNLEPTAVKHSPRHCGIMQKRCTSEWGGKEATYFS